MLKAVRSCFNQIKDPTANHKNCKITLTYCLLSGMAVFGLKYSSLLQLDNDRGDEDIVGNLKTVKEHGMAFMFAIKSNRLVSVEKGTGIKSRISIFLKNLGYVRVFRTNLQE